MKRIGFALLPTLFLVVPITKLSAQQLIPAGSMIQCTVAEPKLSSKTDDVGDPVLCHVSHVEMLGRSVLPYGTSLVGRFEDYKDPGHLVGKGWMELKFDRMVIPPDGVYPISAKVVYAPKYDLDKQGRIHGKGHAVRDTVEWMVPVLWPIDLIELPRRGPRPQLKAETRLTLKLMDDMEVPIPAQNSARNYYYPQQTVPQQSQQQNPYGFSPRPPAPYYAPQAAPAPAPDPYVQVVAPAARPVLPAPRIITVLMLRDGFGQFASDYWYEGSGQVRYVAMNGGSFVIPAEALDFQRTVEVNRRRGVPFNVRSVAY